MKVLKSILIVSLGLGMFLTAQAKNKTAKGFIYDEQLSMKIKGGIKPLLNQQINVPATVVGFAHLYEDGEHIKGK